MELWPSRTSMTHKPIECIYYVTKSPLGSGSYATVREAIHAETNLHYAVKVIGKKTIKGREQIIDNEIAVLKKLAHYNHPNLLTLNDYFETDENIYLVTDLCTGGDLFDKISERGSFYESDAASLISSLLQAVAFLHDHHIIHRDIKAENLIFKTCSKKSEILITDFGLAQHVKPHQRLTLFCGTLSYLAPEILLAKYPALRCNLPHSIFTYSYPVDIWSIGAVAYFMLCGYMPFDCETDDETREAIVTGDYYFEPSEYWDHISKDAKDFLSQCFAVDQQQRPTAHQLSLHPFLTNTDRKSMNLLPTVRSNLSLHKLGLTARHNSSGSSPRHSFVDVKAGLLTPIATPSEGDYFTGTHNSIAKLRELLARPNTPFATPPPPPIDKHRSYIRQTRSSSLQGNRMDGRLCEEPRVVDCENLSLGSVINSRANSRRNSVTLNA